MTRGIHVKKLTMRDREDICAAYEAGAAVIALARDYSVDRAAIRHHLIQRGIALRGHRGQIHGHRGHGQTVAIVATRKE